MQKWQMSFISFLGLGANNTSTAEKLVSACGGFISISLVAYVSFQVTGAEGTAMLVPSMGATAVLLYAVPHGALSQPWPLFAGNFLSAVVGVSCYQFIPNIYLAAGIAMGLSIGLMHVCRCMHPPGGATAIVAVLGGSSITSLGYDYVLAPIMLNVVIIFIIAVVFNSVFPWRRYPISLMRFTDAPVKVKGEASPQIGREQIDLALQDMDLVVDMSSADIQRLISLSLEHAGKQTLASGQIKLGHFYTNGLHGAAWSVRRIIDEYCSEDPLKDMVIYRVVEGHGLRSSDSCTRQEFATWAAREVISANT